MDRVTVYAGQIPLETDLLRTNKFAMMAVSKLAAAMLGTSTIVNGLACVPTGPASLQVIVNPGEIYSLTNVDNTAYSSIPADTSHQILKQGILLDAVNLSCPAPGAGGQSINYLIQATYQDSDTDLTALPYYNASNPTQAWSGPNNSGTAQATTRKGIVTVSAKAGTAAATGSQVTPAPDSGYVGLWVVTVANGQSAITAGNIVAANGAPVLPSPLLTMIQQAPAVVGDMRNAKMSVTSASASATFTADEIIVESALGGSTYKLANFSKAINLATTGAGGMDTGSAPTSGYVALYAIYNPATGASALLGKNATSGVQPSVYSGSNMPAGYTASALVSVWPTNASGQFVAGFQEGRSVGIAVATALNTSTQQASYTALSIAGIVPPNAIAVVGTMTAGSSITSTLVISVASNTVGSGVRTASFGTTGAQSYTVPYPRVALSAAQTIYYVATSTAGTPAFLINISGYEF